MVGKWTGGAFPLLRPIMGRGAGPWPPLPGPEDIERPAKIVNFN
jgi:hypothetical protein